MAEEEVVPEELEDDYEKDLIDSGLVGILDMLNFKIVPKEPSDPGFSRFNAVIPPESRQYASEYVRLQDQHEKLKEELAAVTSSSVRLREELTEKDEVLGRERKVGKEAKEALVGAQREAEEAKEALVGAQREAKEAKEALVGAQREVEESKEAVLTKQKEVDEAKEALLMEQRKVEEGQQALAAVQREAEEAKQSVVKEQERVDNLRGMVSKMQQQINEGEQKSQEQLEEQEKLEQLISSTRKELDEVKLKITKKEKEIEKSGQANEHLRKQNEEIGEVSRLDKENLEKIQKEKEKLEEDLRKAKSANSQLQENINTIGTSNFKVQLQLDTLQARFSGMEDKLKEEIAKCADYKTKLEEATSQVSTQQDQLKEAAEIITEMKKAEDKFEILKTQFETVVQINLSLDDQVADLQRKLTEKTNEVESVQRELNTEKEEKNRIQTKFTRCRESLQSCNLELVQFIDELKNTIGYTDEGVAPAEPDTLQSKLESLSVHVQSKLKSREDNLKELRAELAKTKDTILAINEQLRRQKDERLSMPPPPQPPISRRAIMPPPTRPSVSRKAIMPPPLASSSGSLISTLSYRDVTRPQELESSIAITSDDLFSDFDFPSLEISHGILPLSFSDSDIDFDAIVNEDDDNIEVVELIGCRECGRTFPTRPELYHHQRAVHTVQMSKKVVQRRATSVKSLFGAFSTKQKKKKGIPKIKIKQRKTRSGERWNIVAASPAPSIIRNDGDEENQNENTLMNERMPLSSREPIDQNSQYHEQNPSSSSQNMETESRPPQYRLPLSEVSNSTAVTVGVGVATVGQPKQHGVDETRDGTFCICGVKSKDKYQLTAHIKYYMEDPKYRCTTCGQRFKTSTSVKRHNLRAHKKVVRNVRKRTMESCRNCRQKFYTKEQLKRHQAAMHASISHPTYANTKRSQPDNQQSLASQGDDSISAAPMTSRSTHQPQPGMHGVDFSKQKQGAFCVCGRKFSKKENLLTHIGYFTSEWKFECGKCTQRCYYLTYLRRHYADVHNDPSILNEFKAGCKECGEMFRSWEAFHVHLKTKHPKAKADGILLRAKPRNHQKRRLPPSYKVTTTKNASRVKKSHYLNIPHDHLGDKKFKCNICYQMHKTVIELQSHQKSVHNVKNLRSYSGCQHCGKEFLSQEELQNHVSRLHPGTAGIRKISPLISKPTSDIRVPSSSSSQPLEVDITRIKIEPTDLELGAITDHNNTGVKHGIDHSKARRGFYCKCGLKTSGRFAKYNLQKHIKYAKAKNCFECPECQLSFKSTYRVKLHMRSTHNMEYTLIGCQNCGNVFENIGALQEHRRSQHSRKRKRIVEIDLTNVPTPAPHRTEEYLEEFQLDEEVSTATAQTTIQHEISPTVSSVARTFAPIPQSVPVQKSTTKQVPLSQKTLSLPTLPKKKHEKDKSKRHLGFYCVCGTKTRTAAQLYGHITYFTSDKKFECELCGHRSLYLAQLKQHLKSTHKLTNSHQLDQMGMGCSSCGKRGFATLKDLTNHKFNAHSQPNDSTGQDVSSDGNLKSRCVEPQPSTSKGLTGPTRDHVSYESGHAATPSIIISTSSFSITPVVPISTSSLLGTLQAPGSASLKLIKKAVVHHAIDQAKFKIGLYVCICGYKSKNRKNLRWHINTKTTQKKYACPFCKKRFHFMSVLKRHTESGHKHHNRDISGCPTCFKVLLSKKELVTHFLTHTQSNQQERQPAAISSEAIIEQAESALSSNVWVPVTPSISVSLRTATSGPGVVTLPSNPSSLDVVPASSSSFATGEKRDDEDMIIDAHLTYQHSTSQVSHDINQEMLLHGFYHCLCGQDFESMNALNQHVKYSTSVGNFICKTCGMAFLLSSYLSRHMLKVHKIVYNISNGCKHCGKNFATNMQLYEHFRVAHNNGHTWEPREQKYTPPIASTSQSQSLSQEMPYSQEQIIEIQDQNAQQESCEEEHAMEEQDPLCENTYFSCKCGVRCKSEVLLKRHIRNVKKQYIFQCYRCPSTFNVHGNLKSHVVRVHKIPYEKGKYSCGVCAETFETCERMKTHKKDIHGTI